MDDWKSRLVIESMLPHFNMVGNRQEPRKLQESVRKWAMGGGGCWMILTLHLNMRCVVEILCAHLVLETDWTYKGLESKRPTPAPTPTPTPDSVGFYNKNTKKVGKGKDSYLTVWPLHLFSKSLVTFVLPSLGIQPSSKCLRLSIGDSSGSPKGKLDGRTYESLWLLESDSWCLHHHHSTKIRLAGAAAHTMVLISGY